MPLNCESVTRPGILGNPFTGQLAVERFRAYAVAMLSDQKPLTLFRIYGHGVVATQFIRLRQNFVSRMKDIATYRRSVACYCAEGDQCHGDVILELAEKIRKGEPLS